MRYAAREGRGVEAWPGMVLRSVRRPATTRRRSATAGSPPATTAISPRRSAATRTWSATARSWPRSGSARSRPAPGSRTLAAHCSQAERDAERLERRGTAICLAFLLERRLFDEGWDAPFEGEVVGLIEAGAFVRFGEVFEGFMPARLWRGERAALDPLGVSLVARGGGGFGSATA